MAQPALSQDPRQMRKQMIRMLVVAMIPLILFYVVEKFYGIMAGVYAAMAGGIAEFIYYYIKDRKVDFFCLFSTGLIVGMGLISILTGSGIFVKLKPAIPEMIFALLFLGSSIIKKPLMMILSKKHVGNIKFNEVQESYLNGVNLRMGIFFLVHAALTVYSAIWLSSDWWMFIKGFLFYIMMGVLFLFEIIYNRLVIRKRLAGLLDKKLDKGYSDIARKRLHRTP